MRADRSPRQTASRAAADPQAASGAVARRVDHTPRGENLRSLAEWVRAAQPALQTRAASPPPARLIPSRHSVPAGPSGPVAQLAWLEGAYPQKWDVLIDGVQWHRLADGRIWYKIVGDREEFRMFEGERLARTFEAWDRVEARGMAAVISDRLATYEDDLTRGMKPRELRDFKKDRGLGKVRGNAGTAVLENDKDRTVALDGWLDVHDELGSLPRPEAGELKAQDAASAGEAASAPPPPRSEKEEPLRTKFKTLFHPDPAGGGGEVDAVVMMEYYRESKRPYFASDAFFEQWRRVAGVATIFELPRRFPQFVYRNNISNKALQPLLIRIMATQKAGYLDVFGSKISDQDLHELEKTENVKATRQIVSDFNAMNAFLGRGGPQFRITQIRIIDGSGGPSLRFTIDPV